MSRSKPVLRFSPTAFAKLLFLRDQGNTEVGGFGISPANEPLFVEDVQLVRQTCSWAHVAFEDDGVADFFDQQVDEGRRPEQFGRLWIHTHPGNCPQPSGTDEQTFERVFGRADWAVMFILAREGESFGRLRFNVGPGLDVELSIEIDYGRSFGGCNPDGWAREYAENVCEELLLTRSPAPATQRTAPRSDWTPNDWYEPWFEYLDHNLDYPARTRHD